MSKYIERAIGYLKKRMKKIIMGIVICGVIIAALGVTATVVIYNKINANVNYTEEQAKEIALQEIPGEVVKVKKDLDLDDMAFEYDIKIKDANNRIKEVSVDAEFGAVTDVDR